MSNTTPAEAITLISRYERRIRHLEEVEIPAARESAAQSQLIGRYARAADYLRLAWQCRDEADLLSWCVADLQKRFTRDELCHSPVAPQGSRSEGLT